MSKNKITHFFAQSSGEQPHLVGIRGYFSDYPLVVEWGKGELIGVEFLYSNNTSTKSGDCTSTRVTDVIQFEKGEHIVGLDFGDESFSEEEDGDYDSDDDEDEEKSNNGSSILSSLTIYTSRWAGRAVGFSFRDKPEASEGLAPYVGLNDDECLLHLAGEEFVCKRGMRVSGMIFENGTITSMIQEPIVKGQNEKWWEKHVAYKPWENLKFQLDPDSTHWYLAGVRAYYTENHQYTDDGFVIGVEFIYSDGVTTESGDCSGERRVDYIPFEKDEHIIAIDFENSYGSGINHLTLYTSHPSGRQIEFWTYHFDDCSEDSRSMWSDIGVYASKVTKAGRKFTCKHGKRVAGITFENGLITGITQDRIPGGQNEKWWELRKKILTADRKAHGFNKRKKKHDIIDQDPSSDGDY